MSTPPNTRTCIQCGREMPLRELGTLNVEGEVGFRCMNRNACRLVGLQRSMERPFRAFAKGKGEWWHPVSESGRIYENMRYDAEAVLSGYLPGVTIHIFGPEEKG